MSTEKFADLLQNLRGGTELVRKIGQRIHQERKALSLTLVAAGKRLGISHAYLCEIEKGRKPAPFRILDGVGQWRGRSLEWLLFGEDTPDATPGDRVGEGQAAYATRTPPSLPVVGKVMPSAPTDEGAATHAWQPVEPPESHAMPLGARLFEVQGNSLRPIALDGQHLVVLEGEATDGELAAVELKDGTQLIRRWWWDDEHKRVTLESIAREAAEPPVIVMPRQVSLVWRIVGVLF